MKAQLTTALWEQESKLTQPPFSIFGDAVYGVASCPVFMEIGRKIADYGKNFSSSWLSLP
jgi:hypothetical protein